QGQPERPAERDRPREDVRLAASYVRPAHFRGAELGVLRAQSDVAVERNTEAAPGGVAVDRRDDRLVEPDLPHVVGVAHHLPTFVVGVLGRGDLAFRAGQVLAQVATRAEGLISGASAD